MLRSSSNILGDDSESVWPSAIRFRKSTRFATIFDLFLAQLQRETLFSCLEQIGESFPETVCPSQFLNELEVTVSFCSSSI